MAEPDSSSRNLSSDAYPLFRVISSCKDQLKFSPQQLIPGLYTYLRGKDKEITLEDLENALFLLGKDLVKVSPGRQISLDAFLTTHPLVSLRKGSLSPKSSILVETRLSRLIREEPVTMLRYQWVLKAFEFIADLSVHWGLIAPDMFVHRERAAGSLVGCMQLAVCAQAETAALIPDVVYLAGSPDILPQTLSLQALYTTTELKNTINCLISLNNDVDFTATTQIRDYLGRSKVIPERNIKEKDKQLLAQKFGFHLLNLPKWWRFACLQTPLERRNCEVRSHLRRFWRAYLELESSLAQQVQPS